MSVSGFYYGGLQVPFPVLLSNTSTTELLTATDNSTTVSSVSIGNDSGSAVQVKLYYYDGATDFLVFIRSIPANDTVVLSNMPLALRNGNKLKAQASTGNVITITPIVTRSHPNEVPR